MGPYRRPAAWRRTWTTVAMVSSMKAGGGHEDHARLAAVEQPAEEERRERGAQVEPRVDEAVDLARGARRRGGAHEHVARGRGRAEAETRQRHHQRQQRQRRRRARDDEARVGAQEHAAARDHVVPAGAVREKAPDENAAGAAEEERRQRAGGEAERRLVDRDHRRNGEGLDADERGRQEREVGEGDQDRRRHEKPHACAVQPDDGAPRSPAVSRRSSSASPCVESASRRRDARGRPP